MNSKTYPVPLTKAQIEWLLDELEKWYDEDDDLQDAYPVDGIRSALLAAVGLVTYEVRATGQTTVTVVAPTEAEARAKAEEQLGRKWTVAGVTERPAD